MTSKDQYFRPRNWEKFQHYSKRQPPWIKLHRQLLRDHKFLSLTEIQQAQLMKLWLLYADYGRPLPLVPSWLGAQLGASPQVIARSLKVLFSNDFIELCDENASAMLAPCKQDASPETETETETEKNPPVVPPKKPPARRGTRLPDDWQPAEQDITYARERGFDEAAIRDIAENFRTYWTAGNGRNKTHVRWSGAGSTAWKQWVRNQRPINGAGRDRPQDGGLAAAIRDNLISGDDVPWQ